MRRGTFDHRRASLAAALIALAVPGAANAVTLIWDDVNWPGGKSTLANAFAEVEDSRRSAQIQFTEPDESPVHASPDTAPASPRTNSYRNPPAITATSLFARPATSGEGAGLAIRFDFKYSTLTEVEEVVLDLFRVDTGDGPSMQWIESISITGHDLIGSLIWPEGWFRQPEHRPESTSR